MISTNDIVSLDLGASFTYADIIRFEHIYDARSAHHSVQPGSFNEFSKIHYTSHDLLGIQ